MPSWRDEAEPDVSSGNWRDEAESETKGLPPSKIETAISAAANGLTLGHAGEWGAALNAGMDKAIGQGIYDVPVDYDEEYKKYKTQLDEHGEKNKKANPLTYGAVEIGAPIAAAIATGGASSIAKAPTLFGKTARGVGTSGLTGAIAGEGYSDADFGTKENLKDTAVGLGLGVGSYGAAKVAGKIVSGTSEALDLPGKAGKIKDEIVEYLTKKANQQYAKTVTGHSKKALTELSKRKGGIEQFGRDARNEGLVKFGDSVDNVADRAGAKLEEAKALLNSAYSKADEIAEARRIFREPWQCEGRHQPW